MASTTTKRAMTAAVAVGLAASGVLGGGVADAAGGTTCTPTTRTLNTLTYSTPQALSPRGHVVADEASQGASDGLWLHRPDGTKTAIAFDDGTRPTTATDVSARGATVGSAVRYPTLGALRGWISTGGSATWLPERTSANSFVAQSVNGSGTVVGVDSNITTSLPGETDFFADPIVWATSASLPQSLPVPTGFHAVAFDRGEPLISIRADGLVSAVLVDQTNGTYLARWATATSTPTLVAIPHGLAPTSVAGRWVVGRVGSDMFVFSPQAAVRLHAANAITGMHVSANGTYSALLGPGSIFGRGLGAPLDGIQLYASVDVAGANNGSAVLDTATGVSVLTCALGLSETSYVDVTPITLS